MACTARGIRARVFPGRLPGRTESAGVPPADPAAPRRILHGACGLQHPGGRMEGERRTADGQQSRCQRQREGRVGDRGGQPDQCGAEHERHLVQRPLQRQRGAHQPLVGAGAARQGDRPGAGERPDLRHGGARQEAGQGQRHRRGPGERGRHQGCHREGVEPAGGQHHRALPVPVGEPADQRPGGGLARRQRTPDEARRGEAAAGLGHQQQTAELAHGGRQPAEEGHGRAAGARPVRSPGGRWQEQRSSGDATRGGVRCPMHGTYKGVRCTGARGSDESTARMTQQAADGVRVFP